MAVGLYKGNGISAPPVAFATHNPNAGPLLLLAGFKKPLATTVMASDCKNKSLRGAEYLAIDTVPVSSLTSNT